jgi:hypothetical protein
MIKSLSPYYLEVPLIAPISLEVCTSFTLQIFVWDGLKNVPPAEPIYEITKDNPTASNESESVNIALLINDYIDFTPSFSNLTELADGINQRWVRTQVLYTTSEPEDYVPAYQQTFLMTQGYGYGLEGANTQLPANNILLQGTEFKVSRTGKFVFPFLIQESIVEGFATITEVDPADGCIYFEFNEAYPESGVAIETSTNEGATWTYSVGSNTSPRGCGSPILVSTWYRLKGIGATEQYSNIYILTIV